MNPSEGQIARCEAMVFGEWMSFECGNPLPCPKHSIAWRPAPSEPRAAPSAAPTKTPAGPGEHEHSWTSPAAPVEANYFECHCGAKRFAAPAGPVQPTWTCIGLAWHIEAEARLARLRAENAALAGDRKNWRPMREALTICVERLQEARAALRGKP